MRVTVRAVAGLAVAAVLAAGCGRAGSSSSTAPPATSSSASSSASASGAAAGTFGSVSDVCHGGNASGSTDQGVTSSAISVGVLTDEQFTKDPQLVNAANAFTAWCNAAGGIDGRKIVADLHQTNLLAVVPAMSSACAKDFVLAGDSEAFDGLAVATRLQCLLPDFNAQPVMAQDAGAALQLRPYTNNFKYASFAGYYKWLMAKYPDSAKHVEVLSGASVITEVISKGIADTVASEGGAVVENATFPSSGVTNWTPYAEEVKNKGVKGLVFFNTPQTLVAFEQALDNIGYHLDWIDANTSAYEPSFIPLAGKTVLTQQTNYSELPGVYPVEDAAGSPAMQQLMQVFAKYAPGQQITLQLEQAWSMWLLFAQSAESCGSNLTRACIYQAGLKETAWTGGGLTAPVDEASPMGAPSCFNVEQATASGWKPAQFGANTGPYLCGENVVKLPAGFPAAEQLSNVGKSLSDLK